MRYVRKFILCLTILLFSTQCFALPDLQVRSLVYSDATGRIVAEIFNQANEHLDDDILVYFYDGKQKIGERLYTERLHRYSIVSLYINYDIGQSDHTLRAVVDPLNAIKERSESNNEKTLFVKGKAPIIDNKTTIVYPDKVAPNKIKESKEGASGKEEDADNGGLFYSIVTMLVLFALLLIFWLFLQRRHKKFQQSFKNVHQKKPAELIEEISKDLEKIRKGYKKDEK